jgi:8-oxo-dGTP pyrophosphatase MutT (NUDIX family)
MAFFYCMVKNDNGKVRNIVGLVVFDGERFLLLHRKLHWVGWEFSKGVIEKNELIEDAIKREFFEETGLKKYRVVGQVDEFDHFDEKRKIKSHIKNYLLHVSSNSRVKLNNPHVLDGEVVVEHDDFKWVHPKEALKLVTHINQKDTLKKSIEFLGLSE